MQDSWYEALLKKGKLWISIKAGLWPRDGLQDHSDQAAMQIEALFEWNDDEPNKGLWKEKDTMFQKARRKEVKLKLSIIGPSGSGKTYSSLMIAKGFGGTIGLIDTERGSSELYSDLIDYDVAQLTPPYSPDKYIQAIKAGEKYDLLIIDSLSHAWSGSGGILDMHSRAERAVRNSFAAWKEVTPHHNALVDTILSSPCHIITTMRTKVSWEVNNEDGKTKVVKVGLIANPKRELGL